MIHNKINSGSLELIKWVALFIMISDHINKYLFNENHQLMYDLGRTAMPLFCFILAYNLARPNAFKNGVYSRVAARLFLFGTISTPAYILLGGVVQGWWPLNIMFTLLILTLVIYFIDKGGVTDLIAAIALFLIAGSIVEFWWPALVFGVSFWLYFKTEGIKYILITIISCASLCFINGNLYSLAAFPLIILLSIFNLRIPKLKWFFYVFYPLHLYIILLIRIPMSKAGYLFFT